MEMTKTDPGPCAPDCQGQMCGIITAGGDSGVVVYNTEQFEAIAESCEEVFMESTWAAGSTDQQLVLDQKVEDIECRYQ